jgi:hypothetical protein
MRTNAETWAKRVMAWRASGQTSAAFSEGQEFTAGAIRHWAHRLHQTRRRRRLEPESAIRVARVVRSKPARRGKESLGGPHAVRAPVAATDPTIVLELGEARVSVRTGFDRETLAAVLDVLSARGGAR